MSDYQGFLKAKIKMASFKGFDVPLEQINPALKPHTRDIVRWALQGGNRASFGQRFVAPYFGSGSGLTGRCISRPVGITTKNDGAHAAVILLPNKGQELSWKDAMNWAKEQGGELPSRPVAALLFANLKSELDPKWHWTSEEDDASYAWLCFFNRGTQDNFHKSYEGSADAVRLIPLTA